jgi:hypothetical protein
MTARTETSTRCTSDASSTHPNHEAIGRRMSFLILDYAQGLMGVARGTGAAEKRAVLSEIASDITANIERIQAGGQRLFAAHGMNIASAAREAVRARSAGAQRTSLPGQLSPEAVARAARARSWGEVGAFAAALGEAGTLGEAAVAGFAMAIASLAALGSPASVTLFILAGGAAFGGRLGSVGLGRPIDIDRALAEWTVSGARDAGATPDAPPASATFPRGAPRDELGRAASRRS